MFYDGGGFWTVLLNAMHATIQVVHVLWIIFSEKFSISAILFASLERFQNQSFQLKIWVLLKIF